MGRKKLRRSFLIKFKSCDLGLVPRSLILVPYIIFLSCLNLVADQLLCLILFFYFNWGPGKSLVPSEWTFKSNLHLFQPKHSINGLRLDLIFDFLAKPYIFHQQFFVHQESHRYINWTSLKIYEEGRHYIDKNIWKVMNRYRLIHIDSKWI